MSDDPPPQQMEPAPPRPAVRSPSGGVGSLDEQTEEGERTEPERGRPRPASSPRGRAAEAHREHLERQSALQRSFLDAQKRAAVLLHTGVSAPTDRMAPDQISEREPWFPDELAHAPPASIDPPAVECDQHSFDFEQIEAFVAGEHADCFGPGFERAATHTAPPRLNERGPVPFQQIESFEPTDGPYGGGYVRAIDRDGRGNARSLPSAAALQSACRLLASLYVTGCGATLDRDGWTFETLCDRGPETPRGPVEASGEDLVFELFVRNYDAGPIPSVEAAASVTLGGDQIFHRRRLALQLVPGWPLDRHPEWRTGSSTESAAVVDGLELDEDALLAGAVGRLSEALGPRYGNFDGPVRTARLPGPPYQFMSRIVDVEATPGDLEAGARAVAEYDLSADSWPIHESGTGRLPHCVLLEVGLQPCGWLSVFGLRPEFDEERFFRNLGGEGTARAAVPADAGTLRTEALLTTVSRAGGMVLVGFEVEVRAGGETVYEMETDFGFFSEAALDRQDGLTDDPVPDLVDRPSDTDVDLADRPPRLFAGPARLPGPMLSMLDEITGWWPDGGEADLGLARGRASVDAGAWYFRAHFFRDPVQPGSLGMEAMVELLQWTLLRRRGGDLAGRPRFEPIETDRRIEWKYRGQVRPENERITVGIEVTEAGEDGDGRYAVARGSLWVDGLRIYEVRGLGTRLVADDPGAPRIESVATLDPQRDAWLSDHRPTFTRPAVPMMVVVDRMASAAAEHADAPFVEVRDVRLRDWIVADEPTSLAVEVTPDPESAWFEVAVFVRDAEPTPGTASPERVASGEIRCSEARPEAPSPFGTLDDARALPDPYETGSVFHGPAFQLLESGRVGARGARGTADAGAGDVPVGTLHPALLDTALHLIPHDHLDRWSDRADPGAVAFPQRIEHLELHGKPPTRGEVQIGVRFRGFDGSGVRFPVFDVQLRRDGGVVVEYRLVGMTVPKGPLGQTSPDRRRRFLDEKRFVPGLGLSHFDADRTRLSIVDLQTYSWFEGLVTDVYETGADADADLRERAQRVLVKDHLAQRYEVHPSRLDVRLEARSAAPSGAPAHEAPVGETNAAPPRTAVADGPRLPAEGVRVHLQRDEPHTYSIREEIPANSPPRDESPGGTG